MRHGPLGNIHRGQGRVLALLKIKPEISQKEMAQILDMRPQSLGELLEKLERNGYITREHSAEDHRIMNVKLTEAGKELLEQNTEQSFSEDLFNRLNEEEKSQLNDFLDRIIATLKEKFAEEGLEFPSLHHPKLKGSRFGKKRGGCSKQEE
jgi:DNA-binding MarR family transcriptional regulator